MTDALHVVILAAGEGKRMNSAKPKVLLPVAGRPMLAHVIDAARALGAEAIHIVYGHRGEAVRAAFAGDADLRWVEQEQQLGTGHAVQQAMPAIPDGARVLVLYGDVPLIEADTLKRVLAQRGALAVLGAELADPTGYGRLVLGMHGRVEAIVEHRDASEVERAIRIINTGIVAASAQSLRDWLSRLRTGNAQGEYYLTDIFAMAAEAGDPASLALVDDPVETEGANDAMQLAALERAWQRRAARRLMQQGVRIADPARFDVRGWVNAGRDVEIDVDVVLEGDIELGDGVRIGPFCRLRNVRLGAGTVVNAHCDLDGVVAADDCSIGPYARLRPRYRPGRGRARRQLRRDEEDPDGQGQQGQPPHLSGRLGDWQQGQHRRRHHHLQLRWREQVLHRDRRRRLHRLELLAGGAGEDRRGGDHRRGLGDHPLTRRPANSPSRAAARAPSRAGSARRKNELGVN
jgi:bifunctional UDP-N-acetylglucosamine pyrophosphorylase/glucosamine-1-phosphate N-acetyltransferase